MRTRGIGEGYLSRTVYTSASVTEPEAALTRTISNLALPVSFTLNANDSSKPVLSSCSVRKAWCGLLPLFVSCVVRRTLSAAPAGTTTGALIGALGANLQAAWLALRCGAGRRQLHLLRGTCVLLLDSFRTFGRYRQRRLVEGPRPSCRGRGRECAHDVAECM